MKSGMIKQDGLWAALGYLEGTLLGKVKNVADGSAMDLLPTLAGEALAIDGPVQWLEKSRCSSCHPA